MWQQIYIFFVDFYIYLISACCHVSIFRLIFRITTKCYNVVFHCFDSAIDTLFTLGMSPDFHIRQGIVYLSQKCYITKQKQNSLSLMRSLFCTGDLSKVFVILLSVVLCCGNHAVLVFIYLPVNCRLSTCPYLKMV